VPDFYAANADFKDPFNEVRGVEAIARIFRHMFTQVDEPRFKIVTAASAAKGTRRHAAVGVPFPHPRLGAQTLCVKGASHLRFDAAGKVVRTPRLLGCGRRAVCQAAAAGRADALLLRMGAAQ
jgi:steroid delta-isomerase